MWKSSSYPASNRTRMPRRNGSRCARRIIRDAAGKAVAGRVAAAQAVAHLQEVVKASRVRVAVVGMEGAAAVLAVGRGISLRVVVHRSAVRDKVRGNLLRARRVRAVAVRPILLLVAVAVVPVLTANPHPRF